MKTNHHFDLEKFSKTVYPYVDEMYRMEQGVLIIQPNKDVRISDALLTRKQIKHIVEQRKAEGKLIEEIKEIIEHIPAVVTAPDLELPNKNPKYPASVMRFKIFEEWERGLVVVMDRKKGATRKVITAHLYSRTRIRSLQEKLNASAAGETPSPPIERHPRGW